MKKTGSIIFILITMVIGCSNPLAPEANLDQPFWLKLSERRVLPAEGLTVSFEELVTEGRCPDNPQIRCVWEGFAEISLHAKRTSHTSLPDAGFDTKFNLRIPGFVTQNDTLRHALKDTLGYQFVLMQLDPYPDNPEHPHSQEDYKALLRIVRAHNMETSGNIKATIRNTETYTYETGISGDEDGAIIRTQAQHYKRSEIIRNASTGWQAVYVYEPKAGYSGSDYIELETHEGSDGASPPTNVQVIKITLTITN